MRIPHPYPCPPWHDSNTATARCRDVGAQGLFVLYECDTKHAMRRTLPKFDIDTLNMMVWNMYVYIISPFKYGSFGYPFVPTVFFEYIWRNKKGCCGASFSSTFLWSSFPELQLKQVSDDEIQTNKISMVGNWPESHGFETIDFFRGYIDILMVAFGLMVVSGYTSHIRFTSTITITILFINKLEPPTNPLEPYHTVDGWNPKEPPFGRIKPL